MSETTTPYTETQYEDDFSVDIGREQVSLGFIPETVDSTVRESYSIEGRFKQLGEVIDEGLGAEIEKCDDDIRKLKEKRTSLVARRDRLSAQCKEGIEQSESYRLKKIEVDSRVAELELEVATIDNTVQQKNTEINKLNEVEKTQKEIESQALRDIHDTDQKISELDAIGLRREERYRNPETPEDQEVAQAYFDGAYRGVNALSPAEQEQRQRLANELSELHITYARASKTAREAITEAARLGFEIQQLMEHKARLLSGIQAIKDTELVQLERELLRLEGGLGSIQERYGVAFVAVQEEKIEEEVVAEVPPVESISIHEEDFAVTAVGVAVGGGQQGDGNKSRRWFKGRK